MLFGAFPAHDWQWITTTPASKTSARGRKRLSAHYFGGFTGDRKFVSDDDARVLFQNAQRHRLQHLSVARSHAHSPAENGRMSKEAEFALKQLCYCPYSSEGGFHFMNQLLAPTASMMPY